MKRLRKRINDAVFAVREINGAVVTFFSTFVQTRASIGFELVAVTSQLAVCQHRIAAKKEPRPRFNSAFRLLWAVLSKVWSGWRSTAVLMQADTVIRWQHNAFRLWWRWKCRSKGGRPPISREMQMLIRRLSRKNVLWSAERDHGPLKLLGFDPPCPDTIRKYMMRAKGGRRKSQSWLTFLRNHMSQSWGMDFFTVPTISFRILYVLVIIEHSSEESSTGP
jgi:putative transposase